MIDAAKSVSYPSDATKISTPAAWLALACAVATVLLLASLHVLSPEFSPSWRVISEYALGRYGWVLSMMFVFWAISSWALVAAIWSQIQTAGGKAGLYFLVAAGAGEFLASVFDVRHMVGHGIAGVLGVIGFPVAALLLSTSLRRNQTWRRESTPLLWLANLSWISVVLLIATLAIMTMQLARAYGGHLPQHAPRVLPAGVLALDGYADRLIVLCNCTWVFAAAVRTVQLRSRRKLTQTAESQRCLQALSLLYRQRTISMVWSSSCLPKSKEIRRMLADNSGSPWVADLRSRSLIGSMPISFPFLSKTSVNPSVSRTRRSPGLQRTSVEPNVWSGRIPIGKSFAASSRISRQEWT